MEVIPAVDVLGGRVVRLLEGDYDRVTVYAEDPVRQAGRWVEEGADLVHVVDLDGARHGEPHRTLWMALAAAGIPFQVGGGIRTVADAELAIGAGAQRVVMGSAAVWHPDVVAATVAALGSAVVQPVRGGVMADATWRPSSPTRWLRGCPVSS
jgi:phosphoribosylformimino-5-aminoimidazole carboxamide ribotide isomerase